MGVKVTELSKLQASKPTREHKVCSARVSKLVQHKMIHVLRSQALFANTPTHSYLYNKLRIVRKNPKVEKR